MTARRNLYVSGFVAASLSYIFVSLAFAGEFAIVEWSVFAAGFLLVMVGFEKFLVLAERWGES